MNVHFDDSAGIERLRQCRREKMQEIIPGLWLGSQEAYFDEYLLERHDITHIITVQPAFIDDTNTRITKLAQGIYRHCDSKISRLIIPVEDLPTENLLQYFPRSTDFILAALGNNGHVLVHCLAGASRSPTVVAAFLMEVYRLSPSQALAKIRESRPLVRPIVGFLDQLQVYEACDYRPLDQAVYLHWQLRSQCETEIDRPQNNILQSSGRILAKIPRSILYVITEQPQLVCAACNKMLAPKESILPYDSSGTDDYYLAQPMDWMSSEFDNREHEGNLDCTGCENAVGEYNWNGKRNSCGNWITPAFILYKYAVIKLEWE
jgi:protein-tyrosine phosphatase